MPNVNPAKDEKMAGKVLQNRLKAETFENRVKAHPTALAQTGCILICQGYDR